MINSKKFNNILIISIIGTIFLMSIGYSVKNKELMISGDLIFKNQNDMRITDVTLANAPTNAEVLYSDYSKKEINIGYKSLEGTNESNQASVTLKVEVTNFTDTEMGILKIDNLPENATIDGYTLKEKLSNSNGVLKTGMGTTFNITLRSSLVEIKDLILKVDFEPFVSVNYQGFKSTTGFKTETLQGDSFSQNIGTGFDLCSVTMNRSVTSNYDFLNEVITIPRVTGNIIIDVYIPIVETPTTPNPPELNGDMIPVYYDNGWKKADVSNTNNSWYDYTNQKWANAVTVVKSGYREKEVGSASLDISNVILPNYKSTNQGQNRTTSNLTLKFKTGSTGETLSFDYQVSSESWDKLTIKVNDETVVNQISGNKSGSYSNNLAPNTSYTIVADYVKDGSNQSNDDTAYIKNLKVPSDLAEPLTLASTGEYPWLKYDTFKNQVGSSYELDAATGNFLLKNIDDHDYSTSDIGKYMCPDGSTTCSELYEITNVVGNTIKNVDKYSTEQFNARETYSSASPGTEISIWNINTMWVWVPRYSYTIKSENGTNYYGKRSSCTIPSQSLPGEIDVKFVSTSTKDTGGAQYTGNSASGWRTNGAFDFGGSAKAGIWVGKFETTGSLEKNHQACENINCNVSNVTIKPGIKSIVYQSVSSFFYMARSMQVSYADNYGFAKDKGDLHMMKNDEWGAVAYLSQSRYGKYGNNDYSEANKEVYINNNSSYITGTSGGGPSVSDNGAHYKYDDMTELGTGKGQAGPGASTTGTIYGVYDMSGGASEYVMVLLEYDSQTESEHPGEIATGDSGFKGLDYDGSSTGTVDLPNKKYYNTYKSADPTSWVGVKPESACNGGVCYGHALSETESWYRDRKDFMIRSYPSFSRGGECDDTTGAGVFNEDCHFGNAVTSVSCRLVLV